MKITHVFFLFVLLTTLVHSYEYTRNETIGRLEEAQQAMDFSEGILNGNYTAFGDYINRCTNVADRYYEAEDELEDVDGLYRTAFDEYIFDHYNEAWQNASAAIEKANNVIDILEGIPHQIYICEQEESRQETSDAISEARAEREAAMVLLEGKESCPEVDGNWTAAESKWTLANTHYTGGNYESAKEAAEEAMALYRMAAEAAAECVLPSQYAEVSETECSSAQDCEDEETCLDGTCVEVECECGHVSEHACYRYQCCTDDECPEGKACVNHGCEDAAAENVSAEAAPGEEQPPEVCALSIILLFGSLLILKINKNS